MATNVAVLLLCGSTRTGSSNAAALSTAQDLLPAGVTADRYDGLTGLPHFDPDADRDPLPAPVVDLRTRIEAADAILVCTPEYAGALPGSFKNLLDWTVGGVEICDKPTGWINVSVAPMGAVDAHESLRKVLTYTGAAIVDEACVHLPLARQAVGPDGIVADPEIRAGIARVLEALVARARGRGDDRCGAGGGPVGPGPAASIPVVDSFRVVGGARLAGEVAVTGAKNSVLKVMAAALLAEGTTTLTNVPNIMDVPIMAEVLRGLGARVEGAPPVIRITVPDRLGHEADYDHVRRIRGSVCVLGPLLARTGRARVALPGGDAIGSRPLDLHILGLTRLGASIETEHGYLVARADRLVGAEVWLDFPSVGATENVLMAAVLAAGTTTIDNVAREPEIVDLCRMLLAMGARIDGVGSSTLLVEGVPALEPVDHAVVGDRIVAGTYAFAAAMTGGDVTVRGCPLEHLRMPLDKLVQAGAHVEGCPDGTFRVVAERRPLAVDVVTLPYPGYPTDLQPMAIALDSIADGAALVTENMFEGRFMFIDELVRLGADVRTDGHHAAVRGRERLSGAPVRATDIRAGAALVLAGLVAEGVTTVTDAYHVDRGYQGFVEQLRALGADIRREPRPDEVLF